jgi:hypothetical protein
VGSEQAVEGAHVTVVGTDGEGRAVVREVGCDSTGQFHVPDLPPGTRVILHAFGPGHDGRSSAETVRTSAEGVVRVPDLVLR